MADGPGVKDLLRFLITRDHMHQQQWLAAIENLKEDGLENLPVPEAFPLEEEVGDLGYAFIDASDGPEAARGRAHPAAGRPAAVRHPAAAGAVAAAEGQGHAEVAVLPHGNGSSPTARR